ncbi:hypothetical protein JOD43_001964 [Pullulanibacillus pueri]|nr:hypothetical protein [Pullulanibacillus pueri]
MNRKKVTMQDIANMAGVSKFGSKSNVGVGVKLLLFIPT